MKVSLRMTQEHINRGQRSDASSCPIALALAEATDLNVNADYVYITLRNGGRYWMETPDDLADFMRAFDVERSVEPITMELEFREGLPPGEEDDDDDEEEDDSWEDNDED